MTLPSTEDVRKYAAEQGLNEGQALTHGMEEKSKGFIGKGAEVYSKANSGTLNPELALGARV